MGFKDAEYWKKLPEKKVKCFLCPHNCFIDNGEVGKCKARMNILGSLKSLNYGKVYEIKNEKIENEQIFHFMPNKSVMKVVIPGENIWNENFNSKEFEEVPTMSLSPGKLIKQANKLETDIIIYQGEPIIYFEYLKDCVQKGKNKKHIIASKGFVSQKVMKEISKLVDGGIFEVYSMRNEFYEKSGGCLEDILKAIKEFYKNEKWIEIKMPLIEEIHKDMYDVRKIISWVIKELDSNVPIHFCSKNVSKEFLTKARKIALDVGMNFVYTTDEKTSYCPSCKKILIEREEFESKLKKGKCLCGQKILGVWE